MRDDKMKLSAVVELNNNSIATFLSELRILSNFTKVGLNGRLGVKSKISRKSYFYRSSKSENESECPQKEMESQHLEKDMKSTEIIL